MKRICVMLAVAGTLLGVQAADNVVTLGACGYITVDIPPAGGANLIGFNFTSDEPLYLEDVFGTNQLKQAMTSQSADKVHLWNGSDYSIYYQRQDGLFYQTTAPTVSVQVEVVSGAALFVQSAQSETQTRAITLSGSVLMSDSSMQSFNGLTTVANAYPTEMDLNAADFDWSDGQAGEGAGDADKVYIWDSADAEYDVFYLRDIAGTNTWCTVGTQVAGTAVIPAGGGAFFDVTGNFTNDVVRPFAAF